MKIEHGREVALAALVVVLILLQFARWVPVHVQSALFVTLICLAFAMIGTGWRQWRGVRQDPNVASWRRRMGLFSLMADTLALILPFISFLYAFASFNYMHRPSMSVWILVPTSVFLSLCGLVSGILSPAPIRFTAAMGGLIVGSLIVSIPMGVL